MRLKTKNRAKIIAHRGSLLLSTAAVALACAEPANAQTVSGTGNITPGPTPVPTPIWTVGGDLTVGESGDGTLMIEDGGSVSSATGFLGYDPGVIGTVTVSGQDASGNASTWTNSSDLVIGQFGTGTMNITDGGVVNNQTGYIGASADSVGTVTVSGHGSNGIASTWTNMGDLNVGDAGTGMLTVRDGGLVNVDGTLSVGFNGTGTLDITDGGKMVSGGGNIGNGSGSAAALIAGPGSSWENSGRITVGLFGIGSLRIEGGATVSSNDGIVGSGAHGDVVVTGAGTIWTNAAQFTVGSFSTGTLRIEDGASIVSNQGYVGADSDGNVVVVGAGSSWLVQPFNLTVGNNGNGSLTIEDGGRVRAERGVRLGSQIGSSGTVILQGTAAERAILETAGFVGGLGAVNVTLNGALLRATRDNDAFFNGFDTHDVTIGTNGAVIDTDGHGISISARFVGAGNLIKDGAGTLTLTGENLYTGGTAIDGGTLRISADANLGDAAGGLRFNNGTLNTTADMTSNRAVTFAGAGTFATNAGTTFTLGGTLSGAGAFAKGGTGTLVLTGDSSGYAGAARVDAGTLAVNGVLGGSIAVNPTGRLVGTGRIGSVTNSGIVAPGFDNAMGTLTVQGDYAGNDGRLEIMTVLGDDSAQTSRLVVNGATSGTTQVSVVNRGGLGARTEEGIKIVDVAGVSNGRFVLDADYVFNGERAVVIGAYGYRLYQGGVSTPTDGDWYLRSAMLDPGSPSDPGDPSGPDNPIPPPLYQPGVPVYEAYAANLQSLNNVPTLQQRVGNRSWAAGASPDGTGIWGRTEGTRTRANAAYSTSGFDQNIDSWKMQLGADRVIGGTDEGERLVAGVTATYGKSSSSVRSIFGGGTLKTDGYGLGATLTWYGLKGFYVDGQAQISRYDSDLRSDLLGTLARGNGGRGEAFSLEAGKRTPVGGRFSVTPQIQMTYATVRFDRFVDPAGAVVATDENNSVKTRWGLSLDRQNDWENGRSHVYGLVNLSYEWLDGMRTLVSATPIERADERLWGELGLGASVSWRKGLTLYGEASGNSPFRDFGDSYVLKGNVGVRMQF